MKEAIIRNIPLFHALPEEEITYLAGSLSEINVPAGTLIFREGDYGDYFLVVLSGELEIVKELGMSDERVVASRKMGDHVGEMSLLRPGGTRTASVRSRTNADLIQITRADFDGLLTRQPKMAYEMTRALSDRLDEAHNHAIHDLQEINRELVKAYEELKAAQEQIIEKEKLERELEVARKIQESILPRQMPRIPGFDFSAVMVPTRAVGGDFFDFVAIDRKHVGLAIADVTDKGVPAAIFMALTRSLLRAEALRSKDPGTVLHNVNRVLLDMNTADMFVTTVYGVLNLETRQFDYARAGHPAPILVRDGQTLIEPKNKPAQPLALFAPIPLDVQQIQLQDGDTLLLYTDGVTDAINEQGQDFGDEGLRRMLVQVCSAVGTPNCGHFQQVIGDFRQSAPQSDDITMLAVHVHGPAHTH